MFHAFIHITVFHKKLYALFVSFYLTFYCSMLTLESFDAFQIFSSWFSNFLTVSIVFDFLYILFLEVIILNMMHCMLKCPLLGLIVKSGIYENSITSVFIGNYHFISFFRGKIHEYNINIRCRQYHHVPFASMRAPCYVKLSGQLDPCPSGHQIAL